MPTVKYPMPETHPYFIRRQRASTFSLRRMGHAMGLELFVIQDIFFELAFVRIIRPFGKESFVLCCRPVPVARRIIQRGEAQVNLRLALWIQTYGLL